MCVDLCVDQHRYNIWLLFISVVVFRHYYVTCFWFFFEFFRRWTVSLELSVYRIT